MKLIINSYLTKTKINFKVLNDIDIKKYLTLNEWKNKTGSYAIQGYGAFLLIIYLVHIQVLLGLPLEKFIMY